MAFSDIPNRANNGPTFIDASWFNSLKTEGIALENDTLFTQDSFNLTFNDATRVLTITIHGVAKSITIPR